LPNNEAPLFGEGLLTEPAQSTIMIEYAISTSMTYGDLGRLPEMAGYGLPHVELGFWQPSQLPHVLAFATDHFETAGFHDPLPGHKGWRWPSLNDPRPEERARTLRSIRQTLELADQHDAAYVLCHFPSVHFAPVPEWSLAESVDAALESCFVLNQWSETYGRRIILEHVGPHPYFDVPAFAEVFRAFPDLEFALDIGHFHLLAEGGHFDSDEFLRAVAPHTTVVHVYNATASSYSRRTTMSPRPTPRRTRRMGGRTCRRFCGGCWRWPAMGASFLSIHPSIRLIEPLSSRGSTG